MKDHGRLVYQIALGMVQGIGGVTARKLIDLTGDCEAVFRENRQTLMKIPGIGEMLAERLKDHTLLSRASREIDYLLKHDIGAISYLSPEYPDRLSQCKDAPLVLYMKGKQDLNPPKILSVVGTRNPSETGILHCRRLIKDLAAGYRDVVIVSGLAYGIDICAHRSALNNKLKTIAVLGHGFRYVYPALHRNAAAMIEKEGALLTEFSSNTKPQNGIEICIL